MTEYRSNQGSTQIDAVLDDVDIPDLDIAAAVMWNEIHNHPHGASCGCPAIEVLCTLYEKGYRLVKKDEEKAAYPPHFHLFLDGNESFSSHIHKESGVVRVRLDLTEDVAESVPEGFVLMPEPFESVTVHYTPEQAFELGKSLIVASDRNKREGRI